MKKLVYSATIAMAAALAAPAANAAPFFQINVTVTDDVDAVAGSENHFESDLAGLLTPLAFFTTTASVTLSEFGYVTFEYLGSESAYKNTFTTAGGLSYLEESITAENFFSSPLALFGEAYSAGAFNVKFTNNSNAVESTPGTVGFGIFLPTDATGAYQSNVLYFGYDDQFFVGNDDNHDDMMIRATVHSPVPEPATWAFMLVGFGAVGYALRRRPAYKMAQAV